MISALPAALGAQLVDPLVGLASTLVIVGITSVSWRVVTSTEPSN
jgi:hypothetical protein